MKILTYSDNVASQNSYLVIEKENAIVIDPGFNGEQILSTLKESGLHLKACLLTHGHFDHIRDLKMLLSDVSFPVYIHESEKSFLFDSSLNYSTAFGSGFSLKKNTEIILFKGKEELSIDELSFSIHHTPGHTGGSSCFLFGKTLLTGDTLFSDGIGRTDLATGSSKMIRESIKGIYNHFSNDTLCMPGHGAASKLSQIKKNVII